MEVASGRRTLPQAMPQPLAPASAWAAWARLRAASAVPELPPAVPLVAPDTAQAWLADLLAPTAEAPWAALRLQLVASEPLEASVVRLDTAAPLVPALAVLDSAPLALAMAAAGRPLREYGLLLEEGTEGSAGQTPVQPRRVWPLKTPFRRRSTEAWWTNCFNGCSRVRLSLELDFEHSSFVQATAAAADC
mmetsp:Transcript_24291/g.78397  ORF Transcript_24291/g.78397 Transcript_24291/m.78397 type:complete len:191 (-) Transcript_24291:117-689(-)